MSTLNAVLILGTTIIQPKERQPKVFVGCLVAAFLINAIFHLG
jgi:hypothetical protein